MPLRPPKGGRTEAERNLPIELRDSPILTAMEAKAASSMLNVPEGLLSCSALRIGLGESAKIGSRLFSDDYGIVLNGIQERISPSQLASPTPDIDGKVRAFLFGLLPDHLKHPHVIRMLELSRIMNYFEELDFVTAWQNPSALRDKILDMINIGWELIDVYSESKTRPHFAVGHLVNNAFAGKDALVINFNLDITTVNGQDTEGGAADNLLPLVRQEFIRWIANTFKDSVDIVQLPDRTSFTIIGPDTEKFREHVMQKLPVCDEEIRIKLAELQLKGEISPFVDIAGLSISGVVFYSSVQLKELAETMARSELAFMPYILGELIRINASSLFLKAYPPERASRKVAGFEVYNESYLPVEEGALSGILRLFEQQRRGTIPMGVYGFQNVEDPTLRQKLEFPDIGHELGYLYGHQRGLVEQLIIGVDAYIERFDGDNIPLYERIVGMANTLGAQLLYFGGAGMRDSRFPVAVKETRTRYNLKDELEPFDPFVMWTAAYQIFFGVPYSHVILFEYDDYKARSRAFPSQDGIDAPFQRPKEILDETAKALGMHNIVIAAEGDQIRVSISCIKKDGSMISPELFAKTAQKNIKTENAPYSYQVFGKKEVDGTMTRPPKWVDPVTNDEALDNAPPAGYVPAIKGLTATALVIPMSDIMKPGGPEELNKAIRRGFSFIDHLKKGARYLKNIFGGNLPDNWGNTERP